MANYSYGASGVLFLDEVTPVVRALFGEHHLQNPTPPYRCAKISVRTEFGEPFWSSILPHLRLLAEERGILLAPPFEPTVRSLLKALAVSFRVDHDEEITQLLERSAFSGPADIRVLYQLCSKFDDGHHLRKLLYQGSYGCDEPIPLAFGGSAYCMSQHARLFIDTSEGIETGSLISQAVEDNNLDLAAKHIAQAAWALARGIQDRTLHGPVTARVARLLPRLALIEP